MKNKVIIPAVIAFFAVAGLATLLTALSVVILKKF